MFHIIVVIVRSGNGGLGPRDSGLFRIARRAALIAEAAVRIECSATTSTLHYWFTSLRLYAASTVLDPSIFRSMIPKDCAPPNRKRGEPSPGRFASLRRIRTKAVTGSSTVVCHQAIAQSKRCAHRQSRAPIVCLAFGQRAARKARHSDRAAPHNAAKYDERTPEFQNTEGCANRIFRLRLR